jgi:hypothetical protein
MRKNSKISIFLLFIFDTCFNVNPLTFRENLKNSRNKLRKIKHGMKFKKQSEIKSNFNSNKETREWKIIVCGNPPLRKFLCLLTVKSNTSKSSDFP